LLGDARVPLRKITGDAARSHASAGGSKRIIGFPAPIRKNLQLGGPAVSGP
jgi:hypothetical protein